MFCDDKFRRNIDHFILINVTTFINIISLKAVSNILLSILKTARPVGKKRAPIAVGECQTCDLPLKRTFESRQIPGFYHGWLAKLGFPIQLNIGQFQRWL